MSLRITPLRLGIELGERLKDVVGGVEGFSHGPDIVGGDAGHPVEVVDRPRAWAGDDAPSGSLRHRWCQQQGEQHRSDYARKEMDLKTLHDTPLKLLLSRKSRSKK